MSGEGAFQAAWTRGGVFMPLALRVGAGGGGMTGMDTGVLELNSLVLGVNSGLLTSDADCVVTLIWM